MRMERAAALMATLLLVLASLGARAGGNEEGGDECICKSMAIRGAKLPAEKKALGPTGDSKSAWRVGKDSGDDGTTLGPLEGNPDNQPDATGKRPWVGYSFEVVTKIEGNPAKCVEIQLIKASGEYRGGTRKDCEKAGFEWDAAGRFCKFTKRWTGNQGNLDKAGKPKIDITSKDECEAKKGKWDGSKCTLEFPYSGANYGPDVDKDSDKGGAYEKPTPSNLKRHLKNMIIWKDKVGFTASGDDSWLKASVLPVVRGTDGKYCFAQVEVGLKRTKKGADEHIDVKQQKSGADKAQIP